MQSDYDGFSSDFPGIRTLIHNAVCDNVVDDINSSSSNRAQDRKGMKINFLGFGFGFADVIAVGGEENILYEVKRVTVSPKHTFTQLGKYLNGIWDGVQFTSGVAKMLICKTEKDDNIMGSFTRVYLGKTYYISYMDIGHGVILYDYYTAEDFQAINDELRKTMEKYRKYLMKMVIPPFLFPVPIV